MADGKKPKFTDNTVMIYDDATQKMGLEFTFPTTVLGMRMKRDKIVIISALRALGRHGLCYGESSDEDSNIFMSLFPLPAPFLKNITLYGAGRNFCRMFTEMLLIIIIKEWSKVCCLIVRLTNIFEK